MGSRVMVILACILSGFGTLLTVIGGSCTSFAAESLDEEYDGYVWEATSSKSLIGLVGGVLSMIAAVLVGIAVSWFAAIIINGYRYQSYAVVMGNDSIGIRYIWGSAIWIGWISLGCGLLGGIIAVLGTRNGDDEDEEYRAYQPVNAEEKMYV